MPKFNDLTGKIFGKLVVVKFVGFNEHRKSIWLCKCDCGNEKEILGNSLVSNRTLSCGCYKNKIGSERLTKKIKIGEKFGRLTVIEKAGSARSGKSTFALWLCRCACGTEKTFSGTDLRTGNSKSCGCLRKENTIKAKTTHGMSGTKIYDVWSAMIKRCENPNDKNYFRYGGRGIKVCDEWHDFEVFYNDIGKDLNGGLSIDRIDVNGNYEPSNCRAATPSEQANNTRRSIKVQYKDKTYHLPELAKELNIDYTLLYTRIRKGWDVVRAVETPKKIK